jgi:hypothetical protein
MKTVRFAHDRETDVPETWDESHDMLTHATTGFYDERGGNLKRLSFAARVAYGMFGEQFMAGDPTMALIYLLQRICEREGAGLDSAAET